MKEMTTWVLSIVTAGLALSSDTAYARAPPSEGLLPPRHQHHARLADRDSGAARGSNAGSTSSSGTTTRRRTRKRQTPHDDSHIQAAAFLKLSAGITPSRQIVQMAATPAKTCPSLADPLDQGLLGRIKENLAGSDTDSWVAGTRDEMILEYDHPLLSVYSPQYYVNITSPVSTAPFDNNEIAASWMSKLAPDAQQLAVVEGGSSGDAASLGVSFLNSGLTTLPVSDASAASSDSYLEYARREINYLLTVVPRTSEGAISHRPANEQAQCWADNVYMTPPFLAYYGVLFNNATLMREAHNQIKLYRDILRDPETGLWRHIQRGSWSDNAFWGTGMAWAVAGMSRVYATFSNSPYSAQLQAEMADLRTWSNELLAVMLPNINWSTMLLPNAYHVGGTFDDAASSALVSASIYRMAQLGILDDEYNKVISADDIRKGVYRQIDQATAWIHTCTDPITWYDMTGHSPESLAFVIGMEAAARDYRSLCTTTA